LKNKENDKRRFSFRIGRQRSKKNKYLLEVVVRHCCGAEIIGEISGKRWRNLIAIRDLQAGAGLRKASGMR